ncbi:LysR family transcriptional regulator [Chitinimonas lacunae]|uniref:LysR family transcriptional regulator n=1 Tax=Chitinimonas lacunae TaxID=1963018 RepID=A0ABV8MSD5_9NEIS
MNKTRFHTRQTTFRQLEVFREVAVQLSVTQAAQALHLAQPTVSTQLAKLTESIGLPLFEQVGKQLYLTQAGQILQEETRALFEVLDRVEMRLAQLTGLTAGVLRLGVVTTSKYIVPGMLGPFCRQHPQVEVELRIANRNEVITRLMANTDDLYVFSEPPEGLDIVTRPLVENALVVIAPSDHPLAGRANVQWSDLAGDRLILREPGSGTRRAIERHFAARSEVIKPQMIIESNEAIRASVSAGLGIAILSRHTLAHAAPNEFVELDVVGFPIWNHWSLVYWRGKALSPVAEAFIEAVLPVVNL